MEEENIQPVDKENKSIKWVLFIFVALLVLLIVFIAIVYVKGIGKGYFIYEGKGGKYRIDLVKFGNMTDYYIHTEVNGKYYIYPLRNSPKDLEDLYLEPDVKDNFVNKVGVYVTQDVDEIGSKSLIGKMEFVKILSKYTKEGIYGLDLVSAFTTKFEDRPAITCNNVTKDVGVIYLRLGNENKIYSDKGCVIIEGVDDNGLLLSSEKFAYHLLEVF